MPKKAIGTTVSKVEGQFLKIGATRDWSRNLKFSSLTPDEQICIQKVVIQKVIYNELRPEDMVKIIELMKTRTSQEEEEDWDTCYGTVLIRRAKHILAYGGGPEGGFVMINSEWFFGTGSGLNWQPTKN